MGLGTVSSSAKARTGGSTDLRNFYATSHALAHGQLRIPPCLGHRTVTGYVSNNHSAISHLICPRSTAEGHCQDTAMSTTAEHFKPFWFPDGQSLLPRHVHQAGSGYLQESPLSCLCTGAVSPQDTQLLQVPPKTFREHGNGSHCTGPAQPGVLQKPTISTKEQSGFTRATLRSDGVLPALPAQPLGISVTKTDYLPSMRSHQGEETLPVLPAGSERGSGFRQEGLPMVGHPIPLVSQGLQAPQVTQVGQLGRQGAGRKELSGFTTNYSQDVTPRPTRFRAAPAWCCRDPTWMPGPFGGIQPPRPSGFSTNNHPTRLWDIGGQRLA